MLSVTSGPRKLREHGFIRCLLVGRDPHEENHREEVVVSAGAVGGLDPSGDVPPTPLWRGYGMFVRFEGLQPLSG